MEENTKKYPKRPKMMGKVTNYNQEGNLIPGLIIEFEIWTSKEDERKKFAAKVLVVEVPEERHNKY